MVSCSSDSSLRVCPRSVSPSLPLQYSSWASQTLQEAPKEASKEIYWNERGAPWINHFEQNHVMPKTGISILLLQLPYSSNALSESACVEKLPISDIVAAVVAPLYFFTTCFKRFAAHRLL